MESKNEYIFILGRNFELSFTEITSVLQKNDITYKLIAYSKEVALIQTKQELDINMLNKTLGGTVKIGKVEKEFYLPITTQVLDTYFISKEFLITFFPLDSTRIQFGISLYNCNAKIDSFSSLRSSLGHFVGTIKYFLEKKGVKARFPRQEGTFLSSVSVKKNKLLTEGAEIMLITTRDKVLIGKTLAVQEFEEFSKRDYGRPVRDMKSGVMPPKLARMMINLAEIKQEGLILDPFCGSGTVLQEALTLGYSHVTATDVSEKAVEDTKTNTQWFMQKYKETNANINIEKVDVANLLARFGENIFDAIITEPYMGPTLYASPKPYQIENTQKELQKLYECAWKQFGKVVKPGGKVVMVLPVFQSNKQRFTTNILDFIVQCGFLQISLSQTQRQTIIVGGQEDFVLREIVKFKKI